MSSEKMSLRDTIVPKSNQLNYDDLLTGSITVKVVGLKAGDEQQPVIIEIIDEGARPCQPYKPCKGMRRVLISAWGDKGKDWIGQSMTLYGNPSVRYGGVEVGGIQISHVTGIAAPMDVLLTVSRGKRVKYTVHPLADTPKTDKGGK